MSVFCELCRCSKPDHVSGGDRLPPPIVVRLYGCGSVITGFIVDSENVD
jgi:hypothetical protein